MYKKIIENRFKKYLVICVKGLRTNYYNKILKDTSRTTCVAHDNIITTLYDYDLNKRDRDFTSEIINKILVSDMLKIISEQQVNILILIYYQEFSEREVAQMLGITQQGVHISKKRALNKIKEHFNGLI